MLKRVEAVMNLGYVANNNFARNRPYLLQAALIAEGEKFKDILTFIRASNRQIDYRVRVTMKNLFVKLSL
jgi:hypothetical protein